MLRVSFKFSVVLIVLLAWSFGASLGARAQWTKVTGPAFIPLDTRSGCAINYNDGLVWAGGNSLYRSSDLGLTWSKVYFPGTPTTIVAIEFFDRLHGVVLAGTLLDYGVYVTDDGCNTWRKLSTVTGRWVAYGSTPDTLYTSSGLALEINVGGIIEWQRVLADGINPIVARNGKVYCKGSTFIDVMGGAGANFQQRGRADLDCNSIALDSCDLNTIYVVNEQIFPIPTYHSDTLASVYVSRDDGWTWTSQNPHATGYYSGNLATSKAAVYTQTQDGIIRSTDHGDTWTLIGGPTGPPDNQSLCVVADSILLAIDSLGYIWRTSNDNGSPPPPVNTAPILLTTDTLFATDTVSLCMDTVTRALAVERICGTSSLLSVAMSGSDSASYRIVKIQTSGSPQFDSVFITYAPRVIGKHQSSIQLHYSGDTILTVPLGGFCVARGAPRLVSSPDTIFVRDSIYPCDKPAIEALLIDRVCPARNLRSIHISGVDSMKYTIDTALFVSSLLSDSIVLRFSVSDSVLSSGVLEVQYDDGSSINVPLAGVGHAPRLPWVLPLPDTLFGRDSLYPCDAPVHEHFLINRACPLRNVRALVISGIDSANYAVDTFQYLPASDLDSIAVRFMTYQPGHSLGTMQVIYDDGSSVSLPLRGEGLPEPIVSLVTMDVQMLDTIGGTVKLPIIIQHNHALTAIDFRMRFDTSIMSFDSIIWSDGTRDSGCYSSGIGSAHIHVTVRDVRVPDTVYALFTWYPTTIGLDTAYFDSIRTTPSTCLILADSAATSIISGPVACVTPFLTAMIRYGQMPLLRIQPNPASHEIKIKTAGYGADATLSIWDALGRKVFTGASSETLNVSSLAEGLYFIELQSGGYRAGRSLIIQR